MNDLIKDITHKDNNEEYLDRTKKLCKTIELLFNKTPPEKIKVELINVEVEVSHELNDDDFIYMTEEYIPVMLNEKNRKYSHEEPQDIKLILNFENGDTAFNDGAIFFVSFEDNDETITFRYDLKRNKWIKTNDIINLEIKYKKYKLINYEWELI